MERVVDGIIVIMPPAFPARKCRGVFSFSPSWEAGDFLQGVRMIIGHSGLSSLDFGGILARLDPVVAGLHSAARPTQAELIDVAETCARDKIK